MGNPSQSYGAALVSWDHTVLPTTRQDAGWSNEAAHTKS